MPWTSSSRDRSRRRCAARRGSLALLFAVVVGCRGVQGPPEVAAEPAPAPASATLVVRSNVRGDALRIDGTPVGATGPGGHLVAPGRHTVTVGKPGFARWTGVVELAPGEEQMLRAVLTPLAPSRSEPRTDGPAWEETVALLGEQLRVGWGSGSPPEDFGVDDDGVMVFRVQNPADASAWHHFSLDLREVAVASDDSLPSVVSIDCVTARPCIHQEICRGARCAAAEPLAQHRWFFGDDVHGRRAARAFERLIDLTRSGSASAEREG